MDELDRIFAAYSEEEGFENVLLRYKIREVLRFAQGPAILDVGCGVGLLCRALAGQAESVAGVDGSPAKIARARQVNRLPNVTYECAMFDAWKPSRSFNTLVATNVLEHVENEASFLAKCNTLLLPHGRLVLAVPNATGLNKRIGKQMGLIKDLFALTDADIAKGHRRIYDRHRLEAAVTAAGFEILHSGGILLKPLSHRQMESWDLKIVDALYEVGKELPDYCSSLIVVGTKSD